MPDHSHDHASLPHLVVIGSGGRPYREYAFAALAASYRLSAVLPAGSQWPREHLADARVADLGDELAVTDAVRALLAAATDGTPVGVLTWDETALELTAAVAEKLSLPHMSPGAAARCRDKYATRTLLDEAGLPAVRYGLAHSAAEAQGIAASLGYPVVVKPRALAGSIGVVLASGPDEVRAAFTLADGAEFGVLPTGHGVLVEEFLDGPEISIDSVVSGGRVRCVHVAHKRLGFAPYFEEVGHLVTGWADEPWADAVRDLVVGAHEALGVELGVTHAEVRLTASGPRLIELNGRLGGDLIPYVGRLATGIDLVLAAAELAVGGDPDPTPTRHGAAEVRFVYPGHDGTVVAVDVSAAAALPGVVHVAALAAPGAMLLLPPRQAVPRVAAVVVAAADAAGCAAALAAAVPAVTATVDPVPEGAG